MFFRVLRNRFGVGVRAGLIAAAATSGVLVAYGLRSGSALDPFLFLGRNLGGFRGPSYPPGTVMLAGFLLHAAWIVAWCTAVVLLVYRAKLWTQAGASVLMALAALMLSQLFIGSALANSTLGGSRWVFLHVILVGAVVSGMRLAQSSEAE